MNAQKELLQAGSAVMGAALAAGKMKEDYDSGSEKHLAAKEQYHEAEADTTALESEKKTAEEALATADKKVEATKN